MLNHYQAARLESTLHSNGSRMSWQPNLAQDIFGIFRVWNAVRRLHQELSAAENGLQHLLGSN